MWSGRELDLGPEHSLEVEKMEGGPSLSLASWAGSLGESHA